MEDKGLRGVDIQELLVDYMEWRGSVLGKETLENQSNFEDNDNKTE